MNPPPDMVQKARAVNLVKDSALHALQREHAALEARHRLSEEQAAAREVAQLRSAAASRATASQMAANTPGYAATLKEQWRTSQRQVENLQDRVGKLIQSEGRLRHQLGTVT